MPIPVDPANAHALIATWRVPGRNGTPPAFDLCLGIHSALLTALEARGHALSSTSTGRSTVTIEGERIELRVYERSRQRRQPLTKAELKDPFVAYGGRTSRMVLEPTGRPVITAKADYSVERRWTDGRLPIERQLASIVLDIEKLARHAITARAERQRWHQEWEEKRRREEEEARLWQQDQNDWDEIRQLAADWHEAKRLRHFVEAVSARLSSRPDPDGHACEWLVWVKDHIEGLDPLAAEGEKRLSALCEGKGLRREFAEPDEYEDELL